MRGTLPSVEPDRVTGTNTQGHSMKPHIETADEFEAIEQDQRAAHESLPVTLDDPLYVDDVDAFEVIDSTH